MGQEQSSLLNSPTSSSSDIKATKRFKSTPLLLADSIEAKEKNQQIMNEKLGIVPQDQRLPSDLALSTDIEEIMDELSVPQDKREYVRNLPKDKKFMLLKKHHESIEKQRPSTPDISRSVGSLKSPEIYIESIQTATKCSQDMIKELLSLEVALRTLPIRWVSDFLSHNGLDALLTNFKQLCLQSRLDNDERELQHQYIRCFRTIMNNAIGLTAVMKSSDGVSILTLGYDCKSLKMKAKLIEILGAVCLVLPNGHDLVVEAFTDFQIKKGEKFRFETLVNDLNQDDTELQAVSMALISAIVNGPEEQDYRQILRFEFLSLGLTNVLKALRKSGPSEELLHHIIVFEEEAKADFSDYLEEIDAGPVDMNDPDDIYATMKSLIVDPVSNTWMLRTMQNLLLLNNLDPNRRAYYWQASSTLLEEIVLQKNRVRLNYHEMSVRVDKLVESFASQEQYNASREECEELRKQLNTFSKDIQDIREILSQKESTIESLSEQLEKSNEQTQKVTANLTAMLHKYDLQSKIMEELQQEKGFKTGFNNAVTIDLSKFKAPEGYTLDPVLQQALQQYCNQRLNYVDPPADAQEEKKEHPSQEDNDDIYDAYAGGKSAEDLTSISPFDSTPAPAPPLPPPPPAPFGVPVAPGFGAKPNERKRIKTSPSTKMRQMQWAKFADGKIKNTVWSEMDIESSLENTLDFADIEQAFGITEKPTKKKGSEKEKITVKVINVLDAKKSYNISIMLSRVKLSFTEIKEAVLQMAEEKLSDTFVKQLLNYIPTTEEQTALSENLDTYDQLGKPEQFYIEMMKISRYEQRLQALTLKRKLPERLEELRPSLFYLISASKEVINSSKLKKMLEIILIIGNFMNSNSFRGNAFGFSIDTLVKLNDIRGNRKGSFLNYLNFVIEKQFPELRNLSAELAHVDKASKLSIVAITQEIRDLKALLQLVSEELPRHKTPFDENDRYFKTMKAFLDVHQPLFAKLEVDRHEMEASYSKALTYFGEDEKTTSETFFGIFAQFLVTLEKSQKENLLDEEMSRKAEEHLKIERKRLEERREKQQKLLENNQRGVIDELVTTLKTGDFISRAAEERRKNKRISKAIERSELDAEKLLQELRDTYR